MNTGIRNRFKHSLQALALPAASQRALFPLWVVITDELALEYDNSKMTFMDNPDTHLSADQSEAISAIDAQLNAMARDAWEVDALGDHPDWDRLRLLGRAALGAFGWPQETPPSYEGEYVRTKQPP